MNQYLRFLVIAVGSISFAIVVYVMVSIINTVSFPVGTVLSEVRVDNNCVIKTVKTTLVESHTFMLCNNTTPLLPADSNESRELLLKSK